MQQHRTSVQRLFCTWRTHITSAPMMPATATDSSPSVKLSISFLLPMIKDARDYDSSYSRAPADWGQSRPDGSPATTATKACEAR